MMTLPMMKLNVCWLGESMGEIEFLLQEGACILLNEEIDEETERECKGGREVDRYSERGRSI